LLRLPCSARGGLSLVRHVLHSPAGCSLLLTFPLCSLSHPLAKRGLRLLISHDASPEPGLGDAFTEIEVSLVDQARIATLGSLDVRSVAVPSVAALLAS
jgi:hypothetical protein